MEEALEVGGSLALAGNFGTSNAKFFPRICERLGEFCLSNDSCG
jgi:hypothetical protein